jgi:hypothetical protein
MVSISVLCSLLQCDANAVFFSCDLHWINKRLHFTHCQVCSCVHWSHTAALLGNLTQKQDSLLLSGNRGFIRVVTLMMFRCQCGWGGPYNFWSLESEEHGGHVRPPSRAKVFFIRSKCLKLSWRFIGVDYRRQIVICIFEFGVTIVTFSWYFCCRFFFSLIQEFVSSASKYG